MDTVDGNVGNLRLKWKDVAGEDEGISEGITGVGPEFQSSESEEFSPITPNRREV